MNNVKFNIEVDQSDSQLSKQSISPVTQKRLLINKYFVDLGLPSGTLWAKYGIGADVENNENLDGIHFPEKCMMLLQPNNLDLLREIDSNKHGIFDQNLTDFLKNDSIHQIPTLKQVNELFSECNGFLTCKPDKKNQNYVKLKSKVNGNEIFFAAIDINNDNINTYEYPTFAFTICIKFTEGIVPVQFTFPTGENKSRSFKGKYTYYGFDIRSVLNDKYK